MIEHDWEKIGSVVSKYSANFSLEFGGKSQKICGGWTPRMCVSTVRFLTGGQPASNVQPGMN